LFFVYIDLCDENFYKELSVGCIMKKVVGYGVAVVGIVIMVFGFNIIPLKVAFLEGVAGNYISGVGVAIVIVGVVLAMKGTGGGRRKGSKGEDEVPIYEGTGKKRKIVGYRKD